MAAALVEGRLVPGDVAVEGGELAEVGLAGSGTGTAVPGFVDLQVNGFGGVDVLGADPVGIARAGDALLRSGVTAWLPTLISAPEAALVAALGAVGQVTERRSGGAEVLGVHLEGPFLAPSRAGVHPPDALRAPDRALARRLLRAGPVAVMTLAPELPGALELVDHLRGAGVVVSCGHSDAAAREAHAAFDRGARAVTHLFNAMRPLHHRDPGIAGAALARRDVVIQLVADGAHLSPEVLLLAFAAAHGRVAIVSDAMAGAGAGDGNFRIGSVPVAVRAGVAQLADGTLAGSAGTLAEALRRLHGLGVPLEQAVGAATAVPAGLLGRPDLGVLRVGGPADLVVLDERLEVGLVLKRGKPAC